MSKFPQAITLPDHVYAARAVRSGKLIFAAKTGIAFRSAAVLFEAAGIFFVHSSVLYLDVLSSLMDILSSIFLIVCLKLACRPPDHDHPFGHGRYEPLGGLILSISLVFLGIVLFGQQLSALYIGREASPIHPFSWLFPAAAMFALEISYRCMNRTARKTNSPALQAEAIHYRIDSLTSLVATVSLYAAGTWQGWSSIIDHAGALSIALFMVGMGVHAARGNFHQLMDRTPAPHLFERVREAAVKTPGVEGTEKIRIQQYGPDAHVDIDIEVKPGLPVELAHEISQRVRFEIQKAWPSVRDVTVHIEPYYANDH